MFCNVHPRLSLHAFAAGTATSGPPPPRLPSGSTPPPLPGGRRPGWLPHVCFIGGLLLLLVLLLLFFRRVPHGTEARGVGPSNGEVGDTRGTGTEKEGTEIGESGTGNETITGQSGGEGEPEAGGNTTPTLEDPVEVPAEPSPMAGNATSEPPGTDVEPAPTDGGAVAKTATASGNVSAGATEGAQAKPEVQPVGLSHVRPPKGERIVSTRGAGQTYGRRARRNQAEGAGASGESEKAVELGLEWLAEVQYPDGHWDEGRDNTESKQETGNRQYEVGITSLATLAFLGAGYTTGSGKYKKVVSKSLKWLVEQQDKDGKFRQSRYYEQGIATMALCEAYGMSRSGKLKKSATKGMEHILANMGPTGGYGYSGPGDDTHVTSFQVMALKSAKLAGLKVPQGSIKKLVAYYDRGLSKDGTTGYTSAAGGGSKTSARTALGLFCRLFLDCSRKEVKVRQVADLIHAVGPQTHDEFQTYYGTYGMFQMQGKYWEDWNKQFRDPVIAMQVSEPEGLRGSWPRRHGGRVCTTAIYIMSLEVYYRYLPVNR